MLQSVHYFAPSNFAQEFQLSGAVCTLLVRPSSENQRTTMSLVFDEYGRPFIILKEQDQKTRLKGIAALKVAPVLHCSTVFNICPCSQRCV